MTIEELRTLLNKFPDNTKIHLFYDNTECNPGEYRDYEFENQYKYFSKDKELHLEIT